MFFFFFKQKTAYEMRISDRSSDVCSSDLLGTRAGGIGHHRRRPALVPEPVDENPSLALRLRCSGGEAVRFSLRERSGETLGKTLDPEIGRAPCRERV